MKKRHIRHNQFLFIPLPLLHMHELQFSKHFQELSLKGQHVFFVLDIKTLSIMGSKESMDSVYSQSIFAPPYQLIANLINKIMQIQFNYNSTYQCKQINSTDQGNVFVFFSDLGVAGITAFPHKYLYVDHINQTLTRISGKYKKIVFYIKSCESGSMFVKLSKDTGIYDLSAANPQESCWSTYCAPNDVAGDKHIGFCLGDLFSVNLVQGIKKGNQNSVTLLEQLHIIKKETDKRGVLQ